MKKIYMTLAAILIVGMGFAQMESPVKLQTIEKHPVTKMNRITNNTKGYPGSMWYYYPDGLEHEWALEGSYYTYMLPDSMGLTMSSGNPRPYLYSFAQMYNLADSVWHQLFYNMVIEDELGEFIQIPTPRLTAETVFNLEEIGIVFGYARGSEVNDTIVDTLLISVGTIKNPSFSTLSLTNGLVRWYKLPYDTSTANIPADQTRLQNFQQIKIALTPEDAGEVGETSEKTYPVDPELFSGLTIADRIVVAFSFLPGSGPRDATTEIGKEVSAFMPTYYDDPRPEYNSSAAGGRELRYETNNSLCGMEYSLDETLITHELYIPLSIFIGELMRPYIGIKISSDDFDYVGIDDNQQKPVAQDITVRPNPATDKFTVTLPNSGNAQVELYNLVGQKIHSAITSSSTVEINASQYNSGVYLLKVTDRKSVV